MDTILSRQFIAVDCQQKTLFISDLPQLICDYGIARFIDTFGFEHGTLSRYTERIGDKLKIGVSGLPMRLPVYKTRVKSEKQYIITDNQGRAYCPFYLLGEFERAFPKRAKALYERLAYRRWYGPQTGSQRERKWWNHYSIASRRNERGHKRIFIQDAKLAEAEESVRGIRKLGEYYRCPYDDPRFRDTTRSWKAHRRTQYRQK